MNTMKTILLLLVAVCYSVEGVSFAKGRIVGGNTAAVKQFPFVVSITDNERHFCGGWIYSPGWVVTAASCVESKTAASLKVNAGQVNFISSEPAEQSITVSDITLIDIYNSATKENDIALLKLSADIRFDDNNIVDDALTFPLAVNNVRYGEDNSTLPGTVMGWGATYNGGLESTSLHYGSVNIYSGLPCSNFDSFIPTTMICGYGANNAGGTGGSACQYDEGGPLVQKLIGEEQVVVGIVSRVNNPCDPSSYVLYTRITPYYSWLMRTAGDQPAPLASPPPGK